MKTWCLMSLEGGWCNQMGPKDTDSVTNIVRLRGVRGVEQQVSVIWGWGASEFSALTKKVPTQLPLKKKKTHKPQQPKCS